MAIWIKVNTILDHSFLLLQRVTYSEAKNCMLWVTIGDLRNSKDVLMCFLISQRAPFLFRLTRTPCGIINGVSRFTAYTVSLKTYWAVKAEIWVLLTSSVVQFKYCPDDFRFPTSRKHDTLLHCVVSGLLLFKPCMACMPAVETL